VIPTVYWSYPTAFRFGTGRVAELASEQAGIRRPLLVTDRGVAPMAVTGRALDILAAAGVGRALFAEVNPNPSEKIPRRRARGLQQPAALTASLLRVVVLVMRLVRTLVADLHGGDCLGRGNHRLALRGGVGTPPGETEEQGEHHHRSQAGGRACGPCLQ
jgi:hypothetical protein